MKLNYWTRPHKTDTTKSLRARTKTALEIEFAKAVGAGTLNETDFGDTHKVSVDYKDGFDLMTQIVTGTMQESPAVVEPKVAAALGKPSENGQASDGASQSSEAKLDATSAKSPASNVDAGHPDRKQTAEGQAAA